MTQILPIVTFLIGIGVGLLGAILYIRWKARKALQGTQDMMENAFEDLPEK